MKNNMKPVHAAIMFVIMTAFVVLVLTSSRVENEVTKSSNLLYEPDNSLPGEIENIISSSCINCHAIGGKALAMTKLNFSEWDQYDREKQMKKAEKMCEQLSRGKMPPNSYIKNHPDAGPTKEQIEIICKWADGIQQEN